MSANRARYLAQAVEFVRSIGLTVHVDRPFDSTDGFLPSVAILAGEIYLHPDCPPSNLLHEAGHLALFPEDVRHLFNGDADQSMAAIYESKGLGTDDIADPDHPYVRALLNSSDQEATAWAWAAGVAAGLPDRAIIMNREYGHAGADIRLALSLKQHPGIHGLAAAGMLDGKRSYPALTRWLQPKLLPTPSEKQALIEAMSFS